jgi:hypothetical protein
MRGGDNIRDRIPPAHLVEGNLLDRNPMHLPFRFSQVLEDSQRMLTHRRVPG